MGSEWWASRQTGRNTVTVSTVTHGTLGTLVTVGTQHQDNSQVETPAAG